MIVNLVIYLGFLMIVAASPMDTDSDMKRRRQIFIRSQWHFLGSLMIPVREASGSSLNSDGTGPAMMSPSNSVESAFQDWRSMVGRLSLKLIYLLDYMVKFRAFY